jgi:hypothetical protein
MFFFVLAPPWCVLSGEVTTASLIVFGLTRADSWSTLIDSNTITTTPQRRISVKYINIVKHIGPGILLPLLIKFSTWDILSKMSTKNGSLGVSIIWQSEAKCLLVDCELALYKSIWLCLPSTKQRVSLY